MLLELEQSGHARRHARQRPRARLRPPLPRPSLDGGTPTPVPDGGGALILQKVTQTNLFADTADGGAPSVDPNLVKPLVGSHSTRPASRGCRTTGPASPRSTRRTRRRPSAWCGRDSAAERRRRFLSRRRCQHTFASPVPGQIFNASAAPPGCRSHQRLPEEATSSSSRPEDGTISGWAPSLAGQDSRRRSEVDMSGGNAIFQGTR